ncbi:MAG: biotin--[acetyl-CoA-carboxylase] ligase [Bacteroidales bacterium]|nr:biotin--[acetyl-CoA-carboxylase] ligase [Bacteroidales bacterium]
MRFDVNYFPALNSTNDYLQSLVQKSVIYEGFVAFCGEQLKGRGLGSNVWQSAANQNLLFSVLLQPVFLPAVSQFKLSMAVALGIQQMLSEVIDNQDFYIKWPNDIYWKKKKIAGILIENSIAGNQMKTAIVGVGLNVNQLVFSNAIPNPTSMKWIVQHDFDLISVLNMVLDKLDFFYEMLKNSPQKLVSLYHKNLLMINQKMVFRSDNSSFVGEILGVDEFGRLVISTEMGIKVFGFKEVEYVF